MFAARLPRKVPLSVVDETQNLVPPAAPHVMLFDGVTKTGTATVCVTGGVGPTDPLGVTARPQSLVGPCCK
jgi:hypothetical protein